MQIEYNKKYLLDTFINEDGYIKSLYLIKTLNKATKQDNYYLKLYLNSYDGNEFLLGYLYFFVTPKERKSKYVVTFVEPNNRDSGIASFLTSAWIKFCLEHDLDVLITNRKQEKPFLLFLLKKYYFEIKNPLIYPSHENTVYICKKNNERKKVLLFNNDNYKNAFLRSNSFKNDNYMVILELEPDITILDQVILNKIYTLTDNDMGYRKAEKVYKKFKDNNYNPFS